MADRGWEVVEDWGVEPEDHVVESAKNAPVDPKRFSLNKDPYYSGYDAVRDEDKKTRWSDVGQALQVGAVNTAEAPAIIADYMTSGAIGSDARREAELTKRDLMAGMTPQGRRAATAPFLAEEGQEGAADVGMKDWLMMGAAQNAAPMVMSIFPAWMATGAAARMGMGVAAQGAIGAGVARASSAAQSAADTASSILDEVDSVPDEKLITIPRVQQFVDEGMNLSEARGRYRTEVAKYYPFLAAIVGAVGAAPEAEAVKTLAGASAKKGLKGAIGQIAGGAAEEFGEEGSGAALSEIAGSQAALSDIDYHNIISNALGGAAQGGVLHGPSALVHLGADGVAPDQKVALETQATKPATQTQSVDVNATSLTTPSARLLEPEVEPATEPDEVVDRTMSARVPADKMAAMQGAFEGREIPPKENVAAPAQSMWPDENAWNTPEDEWEPVDTWGQPEAEPDVVRYDDGTTEEVSAPTLRTVEQPPPFRPGRPTGWMTPATEEAIRQAEAARAPASEQEAYDAYDDYKAEQNAEPDVAYGVDEEPEEEPELAPAEPASSSVQTASEAPRKNPVARNGNTVKLGNLTMQFNPDSIHYDVKGGPGLTVYGDKAFIPGGRKDSIKVSDANTNGVPSQIAAALGEYLNAPADQKETAIQNTIGVLEDLGNEQPSSSVQTPEAPAKYVNTRGGKERFHGTGAPIQKLSDQVALQAGHDKNFYGDGFYTTDAVDMAMGYTKKGGKEPTLYKVKEKPVKLYDMEAPIDAKTRAMVENVLGEYYPTKSYDEETGEDTHHNTLREILDEFRDQSAGNNLPRYEVQEYFNSIRTELEKQGYRGYRQAGGVKTNNETHDVKIFWRPEQDVSITKADAESYKQSEPSSSVQTEPTSEVSEGAVKPKRIRRTKEQIAADNAAKETARAEKAAAREAAKTEKARLALEAAQKRAAEKAARSKAPAKAKTAPAIAASTTVEPSTEITSQVNPPPPPLGKITGYVRERAAKQATQFNETRKAVQETEAVEESNSGDWHAPRAGNKGDAERKADQVRDAAHKNAFLKTPPTADELYVPEDIFEAKRHRKSDNDVFVRTPKQADAVIARLRKMLRAAGALPGTVHNTHTGYTHMLAAAKYAVESYGKTKDSTYMAINNFIAAEKLARDNNDFSDAKKLRKEARVREHQLAEGTDKADDASIDHGPLGDRLGRTPTGVEKARYEYFMDRILDAVEGRATSEVKDPNSLDELQGFAKRVADDIGWPKLAELFPVQPQRAVTDQVNETGVRQGGAIKRGPKTKTEAVANKGSSLADLTLPLRIMKQQMANEHYQQMLAETAKRDAQAKAQAPINKADVPIWEKVREGAATTQLDRETLVSMRDKLGARLVRESKTLSHSAQAEIKAEIKELDRQIASRTEKAPEVAGGGMFGALPTQTKPKKPERRMSIGAAEGMSQDALRDTLLGGQYGDLISKLINDGNVVIHLSEDTLPGGASKDGPVQAAVTPDGKIHLVASNLDAASANGVILHEAFHSSGQSLVGSPVWQGLLRQTGNIVSAVKNGSETNQFWVQAVRRAEAANTSPELLAEEVAAYAIENAENATPGVRAFVARFIGAAKAWALKTFGVQFGKLTPEQLRSLAVAALRVKPAGVQSDTRYSVRAEDVTDKVKDATQTAKDYGQSILNKTQRFLTKAATLDQIRQMHEGLFVDKNGKDVLSKLVAAVQRVTPMANKLRTQSDELAQRYLDLIKSNPVMADLLATLALDATSANVRLGPDPTRLNNKHLKNGGRNAQGKELLDQLQDRYNALSPEAKQLYQDMAAYYREMQNKMVRSIVDNRLKDYGIEPPNRAEFIEKLVTGKQLSEADKALFKDKAHALKRMKEVSQLRVVQGDYFPMMRYGKFVVNTNNKIEDHMGGVEIEPGKVEFRAKTDKEARALAERFAGDVGLPQTNWQKSPLTQANDFGYIVSVQTRGAHFFESEAEAIAWRREHADEFDEISEVSPIRETGLQGGDLTTAQLNSLQATVRNSNYSEEEKAAMLDMLKQGSAVLMSGNRIQKRSIARRKVLGASTNFGRNVLQYGEAASSRVAQLEHRPEIDAALDEMREINKNLMDKRQPERTALLNEVSERVNANVTNIKQPPRWLSDIMSVTFLSRLASPMYSVVNAMQPWMVTYPVLAGRYGPARAASMMTQAYGSIGFTEQAFAGIKNTYLAGKNFNSAAILDTTDVAKSIREKLKSQSDGAELSKVIDMLVERGGMSEGGFEMAQAISQGRGVFGTTLAKVDRIARQAPAAVEDINRAVSAIAAYRLARTSMSEEKAREHAFDVVMNTQGDYSGVNAPRFFNETWLRPAFQFKKYAQMMTYVLADMTHRAFGPNSSKEERKVALGQLGSLMAVQIAMAGTLSLPGIELAKMGFMVAAALGFGGGWDDQEEKLRKIADESFGAEWGQLISRGVLTRALNMDFSQKFSLADMYTFGEPRKYDKEGLGSYFTQMVAGAPGGTLMDMLGAVQGMTQGDWSTNDAAIGTMAKAAEKFIPVKIIGDAFKAANRYSEGKANEYEAVLNLLGVQSANQAEENRKTGNSIRQREAYQANYKRLGDAYLKARNAGDRARLRVEIAKHNKSVPLRYRVFPNSLDQVRNRIEAERAN